MTRPGATFTLQAATVKLIPHDGDYLASFNSMPADVAVYVDITTTPELALVSSSWELTATDLDLDVVRLRNGRVWIDDEDEFRDHSRLYNYPQDVVAGARDTAEGVMKQTRDQTEPFGSAGQHWLAQLHAAVPPHTPR